MGISMKKNRITIRIQAALLAFIFAFQIFGCASAYAQDTEGTTIFEPLRYMATENGFTYKGCEMLLNEEYADFIVNDDDIEISAQAMPVVSATSTNALCITYMNSTNAQNIALQYTYFDKNNVETLNFEEVEISQSLNKQIVTVYIGEGIADKIASYKLVLLNAEYGTFRIYSIATVSVYKNTNSYIGDILSAVYNDTTEKIDIIGTINHDVMISNSEAIIELYVMPVGTDDSYVMLEDTEPYAEVPLSIRFEFDISLREFWDRYDKFAVVLHKKDGSKVFVDSPKYLGFDESDEDTAQIHSKSNSFKGIETMYVASAMETGMGTAVVDVYLDQLLNAQNTGYFYSVEGKNFYFDRTYISSLDKQIKALYGVGCVIYMRFLISNDNSSQPYTTVFSSDTVSPNYRAVLVNTPLALEYIYAFTDYITSRYDSSEYGVIDGIILGKAIDTAKEQNYAYNMTMCEYAKLYSSYFSTVALAAKKHLSNIKMVIPVSDSNTGILNSETRDNTYNSELLIDSIITILAESDADAIFDFTLMLESSHNPFALKSITVLGEGEEQDRTVVEIERLDENCGFYTSKNISEFENSLLTLSKKGSLCKSSYIFSWKPDNEISDSYLEAFYVYLYYNIFFQSKAECFISSFYEMEKAGDYNSILKLKYLMKYIDTQKSAEVTASMLQELGLESWSSEISAFSEENLPLRTLFEYEFSYEMPKDVIGSYALWDFSQLSGSGGWFPNTYCDSVSLNMSSVYSQNLQGIMNTEKSVLGEYASISYIFEYPETLTYAKYLSIDAAVEDDSSSNSLYEIKAVINGESVYVEAKRTINSSGRITLIIDLSECEELRQADYFRISAKEISGQNSEFKLHIFNVSVHSDKYNNADFENIIEAERARVKAEANGQTIDIEQSSKLWIALIVIGVLSVGMVVILLIKTDKDKK